MMTEHEREEDRLWNGKEYVSLPDDIDEKEKIRWRELEKTAHPDPNLDLLAASKGIPYEVPFKPAGNL